MGYTSYTKDFLSRLKQLESKFYTLTGEMAVSETVKVITENKSVDTGLMRNSNNYELIDDGVRVGNTVEYAPMVELGTYKSRPKPFLKPAIYRTLPRLKKLAETLIRSEIK